MADTWHVVSQQQRSVLSVAGGFQDVVTVTFETRHGTVGKVDIPLAQFTAERVKQAIDARVAEIDAVHNL